MTEKLKPHYALANIKAEFADPDRLNRSFVSKQGADDLDMDDSAVVAVIQSLKPSDFDKSMTSFADHKIWHDVYKPSVGRPDDIREIYARCQAVIIFDQLQGGMTDAKEPERLSRDNAER